MKNRGFVPAGVLLCAAFMVGQVQSQTPYYMTSPVGYASGATGGGAPSASNSIKVTNASELSSALAGSKSVILVSGSITTSRLQVSASNKSIIGLPGAKLINLNQTADGSGVLHLKSGSNVIIRNITFIGPGAYDEDGWDLLTNKGCTKLWVDHCEFQNGMDDNFDNSNSADNITVSWCKFTYLKAPKAGGSGGSNDHRFSNLVGGSDSDIPDDGLYSITWLNCWWADGCVDRMVRARNAQIDMLNCYWNSNAGSKYIHLSPGEKGTFIYVENGVFAGKADVVNFEKTGNNNVKFVNCTGSESNTGSVSAPTYTWVKTPVNQVVSVVTNSKCGAGATLDVTSDGVISSGCGSVAVVPETGNNTSNLTFQLKSGNNLVFPATCSVNAVMKVYSLDGRKVLEVTKRTSNQFPLNSLGKGMYTVFLQDRTMFSGITFINN
jgi:pectate lyase